MIKNIRAFGNQEQGIFKMIRMLLHQSTRAGGRSLGFLPMELNLQITAMVKEERQGFWVEEGEEVEEVQPHHQEGQLYHQAGLLLLLEVGSLVEDYSHLPEADSEQPDSL